jgi:hypothetical protein
MTPRATLTSATVDLFKGAKEVWPLKEAVDE